jgi:hypothetical protein
MVAMQMAQKNVIESREFQPHATHGKLRPLSTVDHKQLVAKVDYLRSR